MQLGAGFGLFPMSDARLKYDIVMPIPHAGSTMHYFSLWLPSSTTLISVVGKIVDLGLNEGWRVWSLIHHGKVLCGSARLRDLGLFPEERLFVQTRCTNPNVRAWDRELLGEIGAGDGCARIRALDRCYGSAPQAAASLGLPGAPVPLAGGAAGGRPWAQIAEWLAIDGACPDPRPQRFDADV
jgi:hypothetical protein